MEKRSFLFRDFGWPVTVRRCCSLWPIFFWGGVVRFFWNDHQKRWSDGVLIPPVVGCSVRWWGVEHLRSHRNTWLQYIKPLSNVTAIRGLQPISEPLHWHHLTSTSNCCQGIQKLNCIQMLLLNESPSTSDEQAIRQCFSFALPPTAFSWTVQRRHVCWKHSRSTEGQGWQAVWISWLSSECLGPRGESDTLPSAGFGVFVERDERYFPVAPGYNIYH